MPDDPPGLIEYEGWVGCTSDEILTSNDGDGVLQWGEF